MSDWQVGDLALCVGEDRCAGIATGWNPKVGGVYVVAEVVPAFVMFNHGIGLNFEEDADRWAWKFSAFYARFFRKITPEKADEFDREVIEQMTGAPVECV